MRAERTILVLACWVAACGDPKVADSGPGEPSDDTGASGDSGETGDSADSGQSDGDPFADAVVSFTPGAGAGFGQDGYPDIVLGSPEGAGTLGSTDVLSLGEQGEIVLELTDIGLVDGDGVDLLVFENPFPGWYERGTVAASEDGVTWHEWPCDPDDADGGYPGCAGVALVYANSANGIDPTDPETAGGDAFDLADLGLSRARYVRIVDAGTSTYDGEAGGFDLDALAVVNGELLSQ